METNRSNVGKARGVEQEDKAFRVGLPYIYIYIIIYLSLSIYLSTYLSIYLSIYIYIHAYSDDNYGTLRFVTGAVTMIILVDMAILTIMIVLVPTLKPEACTALILSCCLQVEAEFGRMVRSGSCVKCIHPKV